MPRTETRTPARPIIDDEAPRRILDDGRRADDGAGDEFRIPPAAKEDKIQKAVRGDDAPPSGGVPPGDKSPGDKSPGDNAPPNDSETAVDRADAVLKAIARPAARIAAEIEMALDKGDMAAFAERDLSEYIDDLPPLPDGYEYRWLKKGMEWIYAIVYLADVYEPAYDATARFEDSMYIDEGARNKGKWADMDFRWETEENQSSLKHAYDNGFVPVTEHIDKRFEFSGKRMRNGSLFALYRPKQHTERRAVEFVRQNQDLLGRGLEEWYEAADNENPDYVQVEGEMRLTRAGAENIDIRDRHQLEAASIADQLDRAQRRQSGRRSFGQFNAPFQRDKLNIAGYVGGS